MRERKEKRDGRIDLSWSKRDRRCRSIQSNYNLCMSRTELVGWWVAFVRFYPTISPPSNTHLDRDSFFGAADLRYEDKNGFYHPLSFSIALRMDLPTKISFMITHESLRKKLHANRVSNKNPRFFPTHNDKKVQDQTNVNVKVKR